MDDQLPGVGQPRRITITEDDLVPAAKAPAGPPPAQPESLPAAPVAGELPQAPKQQPAAAYCSGCGSPIHPQAVVCPRCGVASASATRATSAALTVAMNAKSAGLAVLLSLVFTGAGHWYVGRVGRGIAFFAAAFLSGMLILAIVGLFLLPIVWVWAAVDASKCARDYNMQLMAHAGADVPMLPR